MLLKPDGSAGRVTRGTLPAATVNCADSGLARISTPPAVTNVYSAK